MLSPEEDIANLTLHASYAGSDVARTTSYSFNSARGIHPIHHGASMAFFPVYFVVTGYIGQDKKEEFYRCDKESADSARLLFMQRYLAAGVRSVQCQPLYDLNRYA